MAFANEGELLQKHKQNCEREKVECILIKHVFVAELQFLTLREATT